MEKKTEPADRPIAQGCSVFRLGLVLSALKKQLAQGAAPEEEARIKAEIASLEEQMDL